MLVETERVYRNVFLKEISNHALLIQLIFKNPQIHPIQSSPSVLLIKDIETKNTYTFSLLHYDSHPFIDLDKIIKDLNEVSKNRKWIIDKKSFFQHNDILKDACDVDLFTHLEKNWVLERNRFETSSHRMIKHYNNNNLIPILKHQEMFDTIYSEYNQVGIDFGYYTVLDGGYGKENEIIIETLSKLEKNGIYVNKECFENYFHQAYVSNKNLVYSQYNLYTPTGRPSNHFDNVNYAALNKSDGVRKCFVSRYGNDGEMILIDYSAFHPRIISYLVDFSIDIDTDIYRYLGKLYFGREITDYDMDEVKSITMRQFYGGIEEKYQHIKYLSFIKDFMEEQWLSFQRDGYIRTPFFKRKITNLHITDPNPCKVFNYILQASETELSVSTLKVVMNYLKNKLTKTILYTYDSVLFDFFKGDGQQTLKDIVSLMKMGNRFPVKIYRGVNYEDMEQLLDF